jgi:hypothetical protein
VSGTDFLAEATDELYGSDPGGFTERRAALAAQARAAGDRPAARHIAGLRKPTRPAWIINQLVRDDPGVAARLTGLGDDLRAAAAALDGAKIRELSQARRRLIDSLIRQALQQAGEQSPSAALREDLTATFGAALADPEVARELAAGTLLRAVHRADFSAGIPELSLVPPVADTAQTTRSRPAPGNRAGKAQEPGPARAVPDARAPRPAKTGDARAADHEQGAEAARLTRMAGEAAAREARARDAARAASAEAARAAKAERAAEERRRAVADAEQALADATQAADQAAAAERDQRGQVRALEDQLDEARRQLTGARRRVRETQAARQKAQRALRRLPPAR